MSPEPFYSGMCPSNNELFPSIRIPCRLRSANVTKKTARSCFCCSLQGVRVQLWDLGSVGVKEEGDVLWSGSGLSPVFHHVLIHGPTDRQQSDTSLTR